MRVQSICEKCSTINILQDVDVKREDVKTEDNVQIRIMFFECKKCNHKNIVQLDKFETIQIYNEIIEIMTKAIRKKARNETVSPKLERKKDKLNKRLGRLRRDLVDKNVGKKIYDEQGNFIGEIKNILDIEV